MKARGPNDRVGKQRSRSWLTLSSLSTCRVRLSSAGGNGQLLAMQRFVFLVVLQR